MKSIDDFVWLFPWLAVSRRRIILSLACIVLEGVANVVDPLLMRSLIDRALPRQNMHLALILIVGIGLCYIGRMVFYGGGALVNFTISQRCGRDLRVALLDQMNRLSADYHERTSTGEKLTHIERDSDEIASLGADTLNQSIRALWLFALDLVMMAKLNLSMTLVVLPLLPVSALIQRRFSRLIRANAEMVRDEVGSASSLLNEHLTAVPQIQYLGAERTAAQQAATVWNKVLSAQWIERKTQIEFVFWINITIAVGILCALAFGSNRVVGGTLTVGGLVAFYAYVTRIFDPLNSTIDLFSRLESVGVNIRRIRDLLTLEPSVKDCGVRAINLGRIDEGFEVRSVSFSFNRKPVLNNLTLQINLGECIAIIGPSGSGKSTLARLLVRAADPDAGSISLDGHSLCDYTLGSLRSAVCYVPQHPILFDGSIRDNLLYANPEASSEDLNRALEVAQFPSRLLEHGLDTPLGPGAIQLSGGERQRLAIARSLLRRSHILVLDEATSALDAPTEKAVLAALPNLSAPHTLILISHRISTLTWVDRYVLLDRGRIAGIGKHDFLYAESSLYRSLFDAAERDLIDPY